MAGKRADPPFDAASLQGVWRKQAGGAACAAAYPAQLEFRDDGQYRGQSDPPGEYTVWDVGTYESAGVGQVRLSTANDARVVYRVRLQGDRLTVADPASCEVVYVRA